MTVTTEGRTLVVPAAALTLEGFREWATEDGFPEGVPKETTIQRIGATEYQKSRGATPKRTPSVRRAIPVRLAEVTQGE